MVDVEGEEVTSDSPLSLETTSSPDQYGERQSWLVLGHCMRCLRVRGSASYSPTGAQPRDRFHLVYICLLLAGAGFLFPWFSFISAVDYFLYLYRKPFPHVSVVIPVTYLSTTLLSTTVNVAIVNRLPIHCRIGFGYVMFTIALLCVPLLDIGINNCTIPTHVSFYLTLLAVVVVGCGSGVQQSSYYGLSSMLPRRYTQAVMAGESVAGFVVVINRIITKAAFSSERTGAIVFFCISLVFVLLCVCCQVYISRSPMVRWHVTRCQRLQEPPQLNEDIRLENLSDVEPSDKEQLIASERPEISIRQTCIEGVKDRLLVIRQTWRLIVAITTNMIVTLMLFPGLLSEVLFQTLADWTPVLLISIFNTFDLIAKWLALIPFHCSPTSLMIGSLLRVVFIPLLLLCVSPSPSHPVLHNGVIVWAAILACGLGITNGYYSSVPLIDISRVVKEDRYRELAGTVMVWFLLVGLTVGSVMAYALTPLTELASDHSNSSSLAAFGTCSNDTDT